MVLARDSHRCQLRYRDRCIRRATQVDHKQRGDDHRMANLQAACGPCHAHKSAMEGAAARPRERRPRERHPGIM